MKRILFTLLFLANMAFAMRFPLPPKGDDLVGQIQFAQVKPGDTIATVAARYDVGFFELAEANPEVDPDHPLVGDELIVPSQYILPHVPRQGIVINLATMRLYYFPKNADYFYSYPIGIGKENWNSPEGKLSIVQKIKNPVWVVPESIFKFRAEHGDPVPHVVPSGPTNPLGYFAMRLSNPSFLIHGTDDPTSVGRRSSAGCIHLYADDIKELFGLTAINTPVLFINQSYLAGWHNGNVMISAHLPLAEQRAQLANTSADSVALINSLGSGNKTIDWQKAEETLRQHTGIPVQVSS